MDSDTQEHLEAAGPASTQAGMEHRVSGQRRDRSAGGAEPLSDPIARWMESHPGEVEAYRGKDVAFHLTRGIVASGNSLSEVFAKAREQGLDMEELVFDFVL